MGQVEYKRCSNGTYVSEQRSPGTKATDCVACPYGKYSVRFGQAFFDLNTLWLTLSFNKRTVTVISLTHISHRTQSTIVDYQKPYLKNREMS